MPKLVRDRIPEIIRKNRERPIIKIATPAEYRKALNAKLREEVREFLREPSVEELADIQEVLNAIAADRNWNLESVRKKKEREKGGFKKRIILEDVFSKEDRKSLREAEKAFREGKTVRLQEFKQS